MAELADALVSGTRARKGVQVQVLFPAPNKNPNLMGSDFYFAKMSYWQSRIV